MFAVVGVDRPIEKIVEDWDFLEDTIVKKFTSWQSVGDNLMGIRRRQITLQEVIDPKKGKFNSISLTPDGIVSKQHRGLKMHITPGGVPHRVEHGFGFWHINDMDELYLPIPPRSGEAMGHIVVLMQTPTGDEAESYAQYCQQCLTILYEFPYESGRYGLTGIWRAEEEAVRSYNADPKNRLCPECGHLNPLGYCWNVAKDSPEQAEARLLW